MMSQPSAPEDIAAGAGVASGGGDSVALGEGCSLDEAQEWSVCAHCLPLPGDALVCTQRRRPSGEVTGAIHRSSVSRRAGGEGGSGATCPQLRRQLADGASLLEGGAPLHDRYTPVTRTLHEVFSRGVRRGDITKQRLTHIAAFSDPSRGS